MRSFRPFAILAGGILAGVGALVACGDDSSSDSPQGDAGSDVTTIPETSTPTDSNTNAPDTGIRCRVEDPFTAPKEVALGTATDDDHPRLSDDETELFFQTQRVVDGGTGIFLARRANSTATFEAPVFAGVPNPTTDGGIPADPAVTGEATDLYFSINGQLARVTRPSRTAPFGTEVLFLTDLYDPNYAAFDPHVAAGAAVIYFARRKNGETTESIWRAGNKGAGKFSTPVMVNLPDSANNPMTAPDDSVLYYRSNVTNGIRRVTLDPVTKQPVGPPDDEAELNVAADGGSNRPGTLTLDLCRIYFASGPVNDSKIWSASRSPR